ncbi:uncharacterized protein MKZ38_005862 [Zalerion maritima]|uniref:C2H2-type domain-containing protein n=1 Tax=Zalerion maritima TaxID=339359 RepID=A0AAD5WQP4_9PEZI|nr:uncharacterized protein MKZ38_005862 [Zalerion maritima]
MGEQHESDNNYCADCDRQFMNENNLRQHLNSRAHRPADSILCPFCSKGFATATGLCHHLERGCCAAMPSLNRDEIYRLVRHRDSRGVISNKLLDWQGSTAYEPNESCFNGMEYECFLCHRTFAGLRGLTQHINSPFHQANYYHCPNGACNKQFTTLAAIMNHLESESCSFMQFSEVQRRTQRIFTSNRMIDF